nr:hypothetical protein [Pedobacter panaciterrae]
MKYLIILIGLSLNVNAQVTNAERDFFDWFFITYQKENKKIYYKSGTDERFYKDYRKNLEEKKFANQFPWRPSISEVNEIILDKNDSTEISRGIENIQAYKLPKNLVKNSKLLTEDYSVKHPKLSYYTVSKPIFFRDQTLCIFSYSYHCGLLCGSGVSCMFQKIDGKWRPIFSLGYWGS